MTEQSPVIVGAICARGGSKGVPRKNLRNLLGKPLIAHAVECARACPILQRVVVSTDDEEIADVARQFGAEVPFMRPAKLAEDDTSKWAVFQHLVRTLEEKEGGTVDILVDLDVGTPLRQPDDIVRCVEQLKAKSTDVVVTAYAADRNPYFNMVEVSGEGFARIVKKSGKPIVCRQEAPQVFSLSPAVYAIRRGALWQYEHWSQARLKIHVIPRQRAIDIDSELDLRFVEHLMQSRERF
jgi:CMP-N,N'-diacetyllegionaminic acid synthase